MSDPTRERFNSTIVELEGDAYAAAVRTADYTDAKVDALAERVARLEERAEKADMEILSAIQRTSERVAKLEDDVCCPVHYSSPEAAETREPSKCPKCGGPADNGHDRSVPPNPYACTKCVPPIPWPPDDTQESENDGAELVRRAKENLERFRAEHGPPPGPKDPPVCSECGCHYESGRGYVHAAECSRRSQPPGVADYQRLMESVAGVHRGCVSVAAVEALATELEDCHAVFSSWAEQRDRDREHNAAVRESHRIAGKLRALVRAHFPWKAPHE